MNYNTLLIDQENKKEEYEIFQNIFKCIDNKESFLYDTGAGAGKTYALKEALIYILRNYGKEYKNHNQNILCVTYTNVAVKEIKERLGNTSIVLTSTIHERIWNIIERFQYELISIHKDKLIKKLQEQRVFIENDEKSKWYRDKVENKENFLNVIKQNKEEYHKNYNKKADDFRKNFIFKYFKDIDVTNISNFKETVDKLLSIEKNDQALDTIKSGLAKKIYYDPRINYDQLYNFKISHDTLLEYAEILINKYQMLQRLLVDKFPIIFIDEYQDTNVKIINFIDLIRQLSIKIKKPVCIGLFGDSKQNIYESGIGSDIYSITKDYKRIKNNFNRRSSNEIVEFANNIRNDDIKQKAIYKNFNAENCNFINGDLTEQRINDIQSKWDISINNQLHCFLLKNENVAKKNLFSSVYDAFKSCSKYDQLTTELFSNDEFKLGEIELILKKLIAFKNYVTNNKSLIYSFIDIRNKKYNIEDIKKIINKIKQISGDTLKEYLESFFEILKDYDDIVQYVLGNDINNFNDLKNKIISVLFKNEENPNLDIFLNLKMEDLNNWYKYITDDFEGNKIIYQTLHSTKGLQYDNVVIELDDQFARDSLFFKRFFMNYGCEDKLDEKEKLKYKKAQNLLYVGITRAVKNLLICYSFDESNIVLKNNIYRIFE